MDLVFDKVCTLLNKLSGRTQLPPLAKNASSTSTSAAGSSTANTTTAAAAAAASKSVTRDILQESLLRHKRLAFRLVLSCMAPVLAGGAGLPALTEEDIVAAEKKCRLEEGGADMLSRPPESFRDAVLPEYLRHKAQFEYKVCCGKGYMYAWGATPSSRFFPDFSVAIRS